MTEIRIKHDDLGGYHHIKFEGLLDLANFSALFGVVKGYTKQRCIPAIVDFTGDVTISDELSQLQRGCMGLYGCPFDCSFLFFVIVCSESCFDKLNRMLDVACPLRHALSLEQAIDMLDEARATLPAR